MSLVKAYVQCIFSHVSSLVPRSQWFSSCCKPLDDTLHYSICLPGEMWTLGCSEEKGWVSDPGEGVQEERTEKEEGRDLGQTKKEVPLSHTLSFCCIGTCAFTWYQSTQFGWLLHQREEVEYGNEMKWSQGCLKEWLDWQSPARLPFRTSLAQER